MHDHADNPYSSLCFKKFCSFGAGCSCPCSCTYTVQSQLVFLAVDWNSRQHGPVVLFWHLLERLHQQPAQRQMRNSSAFWLSPPPLCICTVRQSNQKRSNPSKLMHVVGSSAFARSWPRCNPEASKLALVHVRNNGGNNYSGG